MSEQGIRTALAEHLEAYADLTSAAARLWGAQFMRRAMGLVIALFLALLLLVVGVFVALLASWPTPWRWWVAGGLMGLLAIGVVCGIVVARGASGRKVVTPWAVLVEELGTDLRGRDRADE